MNKKSKLKLIFSTTCVLAVAGNSMAQTLPLRVSGVYPHLATFNEGWPKTEQENFGFGQGYENGIGAITPWAGKLWMVTYSPHEPKGSADKLYSIDNKLQVTIHLESIGGTPANRMIHKESNQLITSNYFIDEKGNIRVIPFSKMQGRMTATARHLTDPANMVYFYDMEGKVYEVNVKNLAVNKLFEKPVPGWHGKGAYTSQGLFVVANNGEDEVFKVTKSTFKVGDVPQSPEEKGVLASWDGKDWKIIERKQFTDVTGPGGIYGAPNGNSPLWAIGWDKRSVILKLLDNRNWYTYRLPKAAHTYDGIGGWYTEWPRIREVGNGKMLMDMHGMMYDFPKTFSRKNSGGISPLNTHLRYIPDFTYWNNNLVIATDETTALQNPMAGRSQSNLWFGQWNDLSQWGTPKGWGGPLENDEVKANVPSDAFLINGFATKNLHLAHNASEPVAFTLQIDKKGDNKWTDYKTITVAANGYDNFIFPESFNATWIRIKTNRDCRATAFFHLTGKAVQAEPKMFTALADINGNESVNANLIRPANFNKNLQVLNINNLSSTYSEVDEKLTTVSNVADSTSQMKRLLGFTKDYTVDNASVIITDATGTFRLPKTAGYENFAYRDKREVESERFMMNVQGTFYEVGRESGFLAIRPVTTHNKKIVDFCTWRGLLVMSGTKQNAKADGHYFANADNSNGLWYGAIDDLWKMGTPRGEGGVWKNTSVKANQPSLPFIMTNYDNKKVTLLSDKETDITLEVDFDLTGFHTYKSFHLKANQTVDFEFPKGFNAHWIRAKSSNTCKATVWFTYN